MAHPFFRQATPHLRRAGHVALRYATPASPTLFTGYGYTVSEHTARANALARRLEEALAMVEGNLGLPQGPGELVAFLVTVARAQEAHAQEARGAASPIGTLEWERGLAVRTRRVEKQIMARLARLPGWASATV